MKKTVVLNIQRLAINRNTKRRGHRHTALAHGYRARHQYRYYPSRSVYYDTGRKSIIHIKGENWEVGASLPSQILLTLSQIPIYPIFTIQST